MVFVVQIVADIHFIDLFRFKALLSALTPDAAGQEQLKKIGLETFHEQHQVASDNPVIRLQFAQNL